MEKKNKTSKVRKHRRLWGMTFRGIYGGFQVWMKDKIAILWDPHLKRIVYPPDMSEETISE